MRQVVLEVTENCNLRCDYCIYQNSFSGFRDFSPRSMSEETAIKAIDYISKIVIGMRFMWGFMVENHYLSLT